MSWVKLDDRVWSHRKFASLSAEATRLWMFALCWSSAHSTDGEVPKEVLGLVRGTVRTASELVKAGLWELSEHGWTIHDYLDYQPGRERAQEVKEANRERVQRHRSKSNANATHYTKDPVMACNIPPSRPVPTRPDPVTVTSTDVLVPPNPPSAVVVQKSRQELASDIIKNPHLALTHEPHRWPEVVRPLEALAEADGKAKPRIGHYASDKAVRLLVEHLASGWEPSELERIYRAIPASSWWLKLVGSGSRPGASWLSPEVLRRHGEGDDPKTQLRASQALAMRHVEATRQAEAAKLVAEVAYTQSLVDPEDDWGQPQQIASNTVRRLQ